MPKLFLSFYEVGLEFRNKRPVQPFQDDILKNLRSQNFPFFDGSIFTSYERIFDEIESSDFLVAIVDEYWTSSTWKMRELCYASGASPEEGRRLTKPIECFVYNTSKSVSIISLFEKNLIRPFDGTFKDVTEKIFLETKP